jgi:undecaprenyl-phosphate 4-deoxy-4-formamido-L-arabinose transferase
MKPLDISVVVPVYRSAATLPSLLEQLTAELERIGRPYEVVLVDDGSPDDSWQVLSRLMEQYPACQAIRLTRNFGQHNALMCGFRQARGAYVVTMDDDLQHPPGEIPRLLQTIEATGDDVVYGVPRERGHRVWRNAGSALITRFYRTIFELRVTPSAFRIIRRDIVQAILSYDLNYTYVDGLLAWNTRSVGEIDVEHRPRQTGRSGYSLRRLALLSLNLFSNFSLLPLQFVSLIGLLTSVAGFLLAAYYLAQSLFGQIAVPGYASLIVAVFVLGGVQLLALGILGEYLGRIHLNINRKPQYTIRSRRNAPLSAIDRAGAAEPTKSDETPSKAA